MVTNNTELNELMHRLKLSCEDVATTLNVPVGMIAHWSARKGSKHYMEMPDFELRLLKYALMTENKRKHLF